MDAYDEFGIDGSLEIQKQLENEISNFIGKEDTIIINTGFSTNSLLLAHICDNYDTIISANLNHYSIIEGLKLRQKKIQLKIFEIGNLDQLERLIFESNNCKKLVIVEGIYSMRGNIVDLKSIIEMKKKYDFDVYVDEAHSSGSIRKNNRGICDYHNIDPKEVTYLMGTFSKTFNSHGGYISSSCKNIKKLRDLNHELLPAVSCLHVLDIIKYIKSDESKQRLKDYKRKINYTYDEVLKAGFEVFGDRDSPVICINGGFVPNALFISDYCLKHNLAITIIGYPATKVYNLTIRLCISAEHTFDDIDYLLSVLKQNPRKELYNYDKIQLYDYDLDVTKILNYYGVGTAGPCGFYGSITPYLDLEKLVTKTLSKSNSILFPNGTSGITSIIEQISKKYKNVLCPNDQDIIRGLELSKVKYSIYADKKEVKELLHKSDSLSLLINKDIKIETNIDTMLYWMNFTEKYDFANYKYIICNFKNIGGFGSFISFDTDNFNSDRTKMKSHIFSASLPAYIYVHNILMMKSHSSSNKKH